MEQRFIDSTHKHYNIISRLNDKLCKEELKHIRKCKEINDIINNIMDEDCIACVNYNKDGLCDKGLFPCIKNTRLSEFELDLKKLENK